MGATVLESPDNPILQEDLELLAAERAIPFESLRGRTVLVTGATGLIGSQIVKALACSNRVNGTGIRILALARSEAKAGRIFGGLLTGGAVELVLGDVMSRPEIQEPVHYIIHGASATSSRYFVSNPVETILTAVNGTRNILELAREKQVEGFLYLSSLEVYGTPAPDAGLIDESYSGYLDPLQVRSSYSEGKRMVECLCVSYASEYGIPVKIARLSQTFGAGVAYDDGRVFAEFARCVLEKKDIVLHTAGRTVRSYCYTRDAVAALLTILIRGASGQAYNVTNMDTRCSIAEMAQLVCDAFPEAGISVQFDMPADVSSFGYNPEMVVALNSGKLMELGWKPTADMKGMFDRLIRSMSLTRQGKAGRES